MLGFGGHNWFKIRPVQTEIFKRILMQWSPKSPGGRQNHWFLALNIGTFFPFIKAYIGFKTGG